MGGLSSGIDINNYLTLEALADGLTASLSRNACEYCVDGDGNWKPLAAGTSTESINTGHTLSFRGNLTPTSSAGIGTFTTSTIFKLKGNCMSMLYGDNANDNYSVPNYAFYRLFYTCLNLRSTDENVLPATTLGNYAYKEMFYITKLSNAPNLPATKLSSGSYYGMFNSSAIANAPDLIAEHFPYESCYCMFQQCSSLVSPPRFPNIKSLDSYCFYLMFYSCTKLKTAPELPVTTLKPYCYAGMFRDCESLVTAPELPATELASNCYSAMFSSCESLTKAPDLPASALVSNCYNSMFQWCSNLNYIRALAVEKDSSDAIQYWLYYTPSSGTFIKHKNATFGGYSTVWGDTIKTGWKIYNDGELDKEIKSVKMYLCGGDQYGEDWMTYDDWINSAYRTSSLHFVDDMTIANDWDQYSAIPGRTSKIQEGSHPSLYFPLQLNQNASYLGDFMELYKYVIVKANGAQTYTLADYESVSAYINYSTFEITEFRIDESGYIEAELPDGTKVTVDSAGNVNHVTE